MSAEANAVYELYIQEKGRTPLNPRHVIAFAKSKQLKIRFVDVQTLIASKTNAVQTGESLKRTFWWGDSYQNTIVNPNKRAKTNAMTKPKKLINWDLDVRSERMLETVNCILSPSHPTNWAIFKFSDVAFKDKVKRLDCDDCGETGVHGLALRLQDTTEFKYCLLRFEYGSEITRHQIILLTYLRSPSTYTHTHHHHHRLIKETLRATTEISIPVHSYLHSSFILSELYANNLVDETLLRVTLKTDDEAKDKLKTEKVFVSKQWKLHQLINHLAKKYNQNIDEIQVTHILPNVQTSAPTVNSFTDKDLDKTLTDLNLYHGSHIYVHKRPGTLSNRFLAAQRTYEFTNERTKISKTKKIKIKLKLSSHIATKLYKRRARSPPLPKRKHVRDLTTKYETMSRRNTVCQVPMPNPQPITHTRSKSASAIDDVMKKDKSVIAKEEMKEEVKSKEIECNLDLDQVFIVKKNVGRGKTACVHYAIYGDTTDIALKEFTFGRLTDKILNGFHNELTTLQKLDHDNICRLLGHLVDENARQLYLAFEWVPCGCLYNVIHNDSVQFEWKDVLKMSMDIAQGMQYLHSMDIVHRDLKSHNLLLDETNRVKITDFGTAKTLDKVTHTHTVVGTDVYCAPEVMDPPPEGYDRRVDVFSYGVLLWEIYTRKNVFDQRCLSNINQLQQGIRPPIDNQCPQTFKDLINECWQFDPQNRPSFDRIVSILVKCSCGD
eukprot:105707_1